LQQAIALALAGDIDPACCLKRRGCERRRKKSWGSLPIGAPCMASSSASCRAFSGLGIMPGEVKDRAQRLKQLSRTEPDRCAATELSPHELVSLILLKHQSKRPNETVTDNPTMAQAVTWIAELGGYTGKSSGGPPGVITIRRGLEQLVPAATMLEALDRLMR